VFAAFALLLASQAPDACAQGAPSLKKALPQAHALAGVSAVFSGARAQRGTGALVVDERIESVTLALARSTLDVTLPLAMPAGARASVSLLAKVESACVQVKVAWADEELVRLEVPVPMEARVRVERAGKEAVRELQLESLSAFPARIELRTVTGEVHVLYLGRALPDASVLMQENGGARRFLASLASLDSSLSADLEADRSRAARGIAFLAIADRLHDELSSTLPGERLALGTRFDPASLAPALRPLARFWKDALSARPGKTDARARFLVDDDVSAVWVEGVSVFDRAQGASTSVEVPVARTGQRVWIVSAANPPVVFDTTAMLQGGAIYNVGAQRLVPVSGGARRECVRVRGKIASGSGAQVLRWRELGSPPGPLMASDEAFRPSGAQDRREIGVVDRMQRAARVPPMPLVYSYTHAGTYEWTVTPEGSVSLRLLSDVKLCASDGADVAAP
jgi:hypothetical protein